MPHPNNPDRGLIEVDMYNGEPTRSQTLVQFGEFLASVVRQIPAEFVDNAKIEFSAEREYYSDYHHPNVRIFYHRPETDAEMAGRISQGKLRTLYRIAMLRHQLEQAQKELSEK